MEDNKENNIENNADAKNIEDISLENSLSEENIEINPVVSGENVQFAQSEDSPSDIQELITVRPVKFQEFEKEGINSAIKKNLDIMQDVMMRVSVEIGKTKSSIREVMELTHGSIVELDKVAGEQVEIYVNGKLVAKGEVIVIEDKFGVRVTTTSLPKAEIV